MKNKKGKRNKKVKEILTFKQAVEATPDIVSGYRTGLSALAGYSSRVTVADTTKLEGSVDIDAETTAIYPNANRWDYAIAYKAEVYFIEVHSANTSEVGRMLKKLQWLKDWLNSKAPEINKLKAKSRNHYIWIQSKSVQIPKNTPQYRNAVKNGILPVKTFELDF